MKKISSEESTVSTQQCYRLLVFSLSSLTLFSLTHSLSLSHSSSLSLSIPFWLPNQSWTEIKEGVREWVELTVKLGYPSVKYIANLFNGFLYFWLYLRNWWFCLMWWFVLWFRKEEEEEVYFSIQKLLWFKSCVWVGWRDATSYTPPTQVTREVMQESKLTSFKWLRQGGRKLTSFERLRQGRKDDKKWHKNENTSHVSLAKRWRHFLWRVDDDSKVMVCWCCLLLKVTSRKNEKIGRELRSNQENVRWGNEGRLLRLAKERRDSLRENERRWAEDAKRERERERAERCVRRKVSEREQKMEGGGKVVVRARESRDRERGKKRWKSQLSVSVLLNCFKSPTTFFERTFLSFFTHSSLLLGTQQQSVSLLIIHLEFSPHQVSLSLFERVCSLPKPVNG